MRLIKTLDHLLTNIETVENYLASSDLEEQTLIQGYIKRGTCFIAYNIGKELRFVPSKFLGYTNNSLTKHIPSETDGRDTNKVISEILDQRPLPNTNLNLKYFEYCKNLGFTPTDSGAFGAKRKFWTLNLEDDFVNNTDSEEFPEGKIAERLHKTRERNSQVIQLAKANFKKKYGRLFCQICDFDFEKNYGKLGSNFIEGHHTIPVCEMSSSHKTKVEDIALLCSNCHRMIHKKRPWLTMNQLKKLIPKPRK